MYTRSYGQDNEGMPLPSGYDGTLFEKEISEKAEEVIEKCEEEGENKTAVSGLFSRLPQLFGFKGQDLLRTPVRLGTEELVLLGVALLLFFTKDGDRECALMIALLLFIK
jgi:hypothetical protein